MYMQACEKIAQSVQVVFESMLSCIHSEASPLKDTFKGLKDTFKGSFKDKFKGSLKDTFEDSFTDTIKYLTPAQPLNRDLVQEDIFIDTSKREDTFKDTSTDTKFGDCEFVQAAHVVLVRALSKILEPGGCVRMVPDGRARDVVMAAVSAVERFLLRAGRLGAAEVTSVKVLCVCVCVGSIDR
jgi:hypothetical protein